MSIEGGVVGSTRRVGRLQHFAWAAARGRLKEAFLPTASWARHKPCPRPKPEGTDSIEGWSEWRLVVEVAAAFGLPLPPLAAVAVARSLARSTLAVANFRLAPTSSASISATDRLSPSGVSQLRWRRRPVTMTRSPLVRESARCSAWPRHTLTLKKRGVAVAPLAVLLDALGDRDPQVGDGGAGVGEAELGVLDQVAGDGGLVVCCHHGSLYCVRVVVSVRGRAVWATAVADGLEAGGVDGVGDPVVLAGQPHDRVGVVLAAGGDGDADAEGQGGFAVAEGLVAVRVVGGRRGRRSRG